MNLEALKELTAKVEAGDDYSALSIVKVFGKFGAPNEGNSWMARNAIHGSLDAAKTLHDAVLPGWCWNIDDNIEGTLAKVWESIVPPQVYYHGADFGDNPARAWLLAILRALIAQGEQS
jgi:hypothetical protein